MLTGRPTKCSLTPSSGRGFDSHRPLHNSRCLNCPYTANLPESSLKMDRFGPQMDPSEFNLDPHDLQRKPASREEEKSEWPVFRSGIYGDQSPVSDQASARAFSGAGLRASALPSKSAYIIRAREA